MLAHRILDVSRVNEERLWQAETNCGSFQPIRFFAVQPSNGNLYNIRLDYTQQHHAQCGYSMGNANELTQHGNMAKHSRRHPFARHLIGVFTNSQPLKKVVQDS